MQKYEIKIGDKWYPCRGYINAKGWLEFKCSDGAQGIMQPKNFRARQPKTPKATLAA
jgi:hypothetical protein